MTANYPSSTEIEFDVPSFCKKNPGDDEMNDPTRTPWRAVQSIYGYWRVVSAVAVAGSEPEQVEMTEANVRLMAAGPKLLSACEVASRLLDTLANEIGEQMTSRDISTRAVRADLELAIAEATNNKKG